MKFAHWTVLAASAALFGCTSPEKKLHLGLQPSPATAPSTRPRPVTPPATPPTAPKTPEPYQSFADQMAGLIRPVDEPSRGNTGKARQSEAFTSATLPPRLTLTPKEIMALRDDIKHWVRYQTIPEGAEIKLYESGVATLDHWMHYAPNPRTYPPSTSSYYEMIYVDGLPVESFRHDVDGVRLAQRIFYSADMIPVCSVSYDNEGKPKFFAHLTYDQLGRIKQVVMLDERGEPFFAVCYAIVGVYSQTETINYQMRRFGDPIAHTLYDGERVYRIDANGERKDVGRGSPLSRLTALTKFGVRPFYPLRPILGSLLLIDTAQSSHPEFLGAPEPSPLTKPRDRVPNVRSRSYNQRSKTGSRDRK